MKKRTAFIGVLFSLMPIGQPLVIGIGAVLTSASVILSVPLIALAENAEFYFNRAFDKEDAGDLKGAISDWDKAIDLLPSYDTSYFNRGLVKDRLGDWSGAISDYSKAIQINNKNNQISRSSVIYEARAKAKYQSGNYDGSLRDFDKAIEINPNDGETFSSRAVLIGGPPFNDMNGACNDIKQAASLGNQYRINWLKTDSGSWCRNK